MRKLGMVVLVVLCLVSTVPVAATDGQEGGSWWGVVVEWVTSILEGPTREMGPKVEPDGLEATDNDTGPGLEPNG